LTGRSDRNDPADIKKVKNAVPGATVNDAVMALVGGGLRHYLNDADELPTDSLVALMPISLREGDSDGLGNKLTCTTFLLGTDIDDPIERVRRLHEMAAKKRPYRTARMLAGSSRSPRPFLRLCRVWPDVWRLSWTCPTGCRQ
jgi:hypothetical protein